MAWLGVVKSTYNFKSLRIPCTSNAHLSDRSGLSELNSLGGTLHEPGMVRNVSSCLNIEFEQKKPTCRRESKQRPLLSLHRREGQTRFQGEECKEFSCQRSCYNLMERNEQAKAKVGGSWWKRK